MRSRDSEERERDTGFRYEQDGITLGVRVLPVARAGVYAPGGKARYPSSVIMSAVPARVAGVTEIILATPLAGDATDDAIYAAASLSGVTAIVTLARKDSYLCARDDIQAILLKNPGIYLGFRVCRSLRPAGNAGENC